MIFTMSLFLYLSYLNSFGHCMLKTSFHKTQDLIMPDFIGDT